MIKQALFGATVLAGLVGVAGVAHAADDFQAGKNTDIATNQGTTDIKFEGDTTTQFNNAGNTGYENPNQDGSGEVASTALGKKAFGLTLLHVPSFSFGTENKLATAGQDGVVKGYVATGSGDFTPSADNPLVNQTEAKAGEIVVSDLRGSDAGYKVYASASDLYTGEGATGYKLPVSSIDMNVKGVAASDGLADAITGTDDAFIPVYSATTGELKKQDGSANLVLTGNKDTNGTYASDVTKLQLKLKNGKVKAGAKYSGFVTYTLQDAALNATSTN